MVKTENSTCVFHWKHCRNSRYWWHIGFACKQKQYLHFVDAFSSIWLKQFKPNHSSNVCSCVLFLNHLYSRWILAHMWIRKHTKENHQKIVVFLLCNRAHMIWCCDVKIICYFSFNDFCSDDDACFIIIVIIIGVCVVVVVVCPATIVVANMVFDMPFHSSQYNLFTSTILYNFMLNHTTRRHIKAKTK